MGMVYRARHVRLDRLVALKVLPLERMRQPEAIARFRREMKAVGNLDHPNIVRAFDAGEVDGKHFLAMELIDGVDLSSLAEREGPLRVADACELVRQAAIGLDYAHRNGLVHRDVKPSNLMLDRHSIVKVLDLGLARLLGESADEAPAPRGAVDGSRFQAISPELTGTDQAMGTPDYMAPEQCSSSRNVDGRSDVYSLGATLYRLLTGRAPFSNIRYGTLAKKIAGLTNDPAPPIAGHRDDLPAPLTALVHRLLAKDPADRLATPGEVATALAPFCRGHRVPELAGQAPEPPKPKLSAARLRRRLFAIGLAFTCAAAGIVLAKVWTPEGELVVEVAEEARDKVTLEVRNGNEVRIIGRADEDRTRLWKITLDAGTWNVRLDDPSHQFKLDHDSVEISRGATRIVKVTRRRSPPRNANAVAEASTSPEARPPQRPAPRTGTWRLTMPAGFQRSATLTAINNNQFRLATGGVLGGIYRWDGRQLKVVSPDDARFSGLAWAWASDDSETDLRLVGEPASHPAGPSYLGARLEYRDESQTPPLREPLVVRRFDPRRDAILSPNVRPATDEAGVSMWPVRATKTQTTPLFEIESPDVGECILELQASLKSYNIAGQAYLELVCKVPGQPDLVSRGFHHALNGTNDWTTCETPLLLPKGVSPRIVQLNLVIEGGGTVNVRDVQLLAIPLSPANGSE
jgi:hypothetical protein